MEETKETSTKLTYEQLEQAALQLQQRLMMVESRLKSIDFASMRLTWLFRVLENKGSFTPDFVNKCAEEVENLLTIEEETTDNQEEKVN